MYKNKTINRNGFKLDMNFENLFKMYRVFRKMSSDNTFMVEIAYQMQQKMLAAIRVEYERTRGTYKTRHIERTSKPNTERLEYKLFVEGARGSISYPSPGTVSIEVINNIEQLYQEIPYLKWQEEGTSAKRSMQFYEKAYSQDRDTYKLYPIKHQLALALWRNQATRHRVKRIRVDHPALPARNFLSAGYRFFRTQGEQYFRKLVREELIKRGVTSSRL